MNVPGRREITLYEHQLRPDEVWLVEDDDLWYVRCMDCGTRIGTVNAGNERGAVRLTQQHNKTLHLQRL